MTIQNSQNLYGTKGSVSSSSFYPIVADRNPSSNDITGISGALSIGQKWVNKSANATFTLTSFSSSNGVVSATWVNDGVGSDLKTLSGDTGVASPTAGDIKIEGGAGIVTAASGSTVTVSLVGSDNAIDEVNVQTGTSPVKATAGGAITINGATVAAGTNPVRTDGTGANTLAVEVQLSQAIAAEDTTKVGLSNFNSAHFNVTNGFVELKGGGQGIDSFATNVAGPVSADATGEVLLNASVTTFTDGTVANTVKTEVQSAAHSILIGAGTNTASTALTPSATSGVPLISQGASSDPAYGTAVVAGGGTGRTSSTAYAVICGGTTATAAQQSIASVGTTGQVLTSNGAGALPTFQTPTSSGSVNIQVFTSNGTYTPTAGMDYCIIEVVGGGGGGGGGSGGGAGGGGSGGYARGLYTAADIGVSKTVTIGTFGAGGASSGASGGTGGTTSVDTTPTIQATGGTGGEECNGTASGGGAGGSAGVGSGGNFASGGSPGNFGVSYGGGVAQAGTGGSSIFGGGGAAGNAFGDAIPGGQGTGYGAGGGGAAAQGGGNSAAGGDGNSGIVIITEFM